MIYFSEIISREDQYEVAKARAEIAYTVGFMGSIVARNLKALIAARVENWIEEILAREL